MITMSLLEMLMLVAIIIGLGVCFVLMSLHQDQTKKMIQSRKEMLAGNHYNDYAEFRSNY